ncbi:MAG: Purine nucleoside phosphorylase 1 [Myxococcota bacterium]|nr:Purine nucleoside phosphorylase 1 [Myxococcota bacterium]
MDRRLIELNQARDYVLKHMPGVAPIGMVMGSGLGALLPEILADSQALDYQQIPHFPVSTVHGHAARLVWGRTANGAQVMAMSGRVHLYEGYTPTQIVFGVRLMALLGAKVILLTNAAGGISDDLNPGDIMVISDHINMTGQNPLTGPNLDDLGERFPDMTDLYDPKLRRVVYETAEQLNIPLRKGVYVCMPGPTFETPAEVRMARAIGGDAVGMSTALEAIAVRHMGARVIGMSCITNKAAGLAGAVLDHEEGLRTAQLAYTNFRSLLPALLPRLM